MPKLGSPNSCLGLLTLGALLGACFDVKQVDVTDEPAQARGLLIDNFDDGDSLPSDLALGHWFCQWGALDCQPSSPGANGGGYAYAMNFELDDPSNGQLDYPSAQLRTWRSSDARLDFTRYKSVFFSAKLLPSTAPLPNSKVDVLLSCPGAADASDAISSIMSAVGVGSDWQSIELPLTSFGWKQPWQGPPVEAGACLAQVDGVAFDLQPTLLDGQTFPGTLLIDDVYLQ